MAAAAEVGFEIAGEVTSATEERLEVRVSLTNRGERLCLPVIASGELLGEAASARLPAGIAAGARGELSLGFPLRAEQPGVYPLLLMLEYWVRPSLEANPEPYYQPGYVLIALGENATPALRLSLPEPMRLAVVGNAEVRIESLDGAGHRAWLALRVPRGLRINPVEAEVEVPAKGAARVPVQLFRVDAPWGSRHGVLVAATSLDGALARTSVATGTVEVGSDPAWLPRLRWPLLGLALLLLVAAGAAELRRG